MKGASYPNRHEMKRMLNPSMRSEGRRPGVATGRCRPWRARALAAACVVALLLGAGPAAAQSEPRTVTVLAFAESGDTAGLGIELYNALRTQIEFHRGYRLNDVPPQTLDELLLAVGCAELDRSCSELVADVVGTDLLAWGELRVDEARATLRMTMWDLESASELRSRSHIVGRADADFLVANHQAIGRSLLYGDEGTLEVTASPARARVTVAGVDRGTVPVTLTGLGFGLYTVRIEAPGHDAYEQVAVVDLGGAHVDATLRSVLVERERERERESLAVDPSVPQWILIGAGGAAVATGVVFMVQKNGTQDEFDDVVAERSLDRARAEELRDRGEQQARLANAFVASGAALVAAGVVWRVVNPGRMGEDRSSAGPGGSPLVRTRVGGFAGRGAGGVSLDLEF